MNNTFFNLARATRAAAVLTVLASFASGLRAQGQSAASMNEDIQLLKQRVEKLSLQVETLQRTNDDLRRQGLSQSDVKAMLDDALAKNRNETNGAIAQARTKIVEEVARQIEAL